MRHTTIRRIQRTLALIGFLALVGIGVIAARVLGYGMPSLDGMAVQGLDPATFDRTVALISGHGGFDSGAVCTDADGQVTLTEADLNARVADLVARRLRRAGADVLLLEEYDPKLNGLEADVLLSIHADSCINASGYKAANLVDSPRQPAEQMLLDCIHTHYPEATGLAHHPNSVTHDMTSYHAFRRIADSTPAAILEIGFMGGDQELLTEHPQWLAKGITDSIICFFNVNSGFQSDRPG